MISRIKLIITGKNPDYLLKEIIKKKINIYEIAKEKNNIKIIIDSKDYETIKKLKTTYKISIVSYYGKSRILNLLKKYYYLLFFSIIGIIINITLSHMIFNIEINHPNQELVKIIKKDLRELGLTRFRWKVSYDNKEKIKEIILEKEKNRLEWLEIKELGTTYQVSLEEKKTNHETEPCKPRNIISKKNAIIMEIQSSAGEIIKKKKDYVEKGEVIISGFIHNKETVVSKKCAIGIVYGETWYTIKLLIPKEETERNLKKDKSFGLSYIIGKKETNIGNNYNNYQKNEYNIIKSKILPFNISFVKYQKVSLKSKIYTLENIDKRALKIVDIEMSKNMQNGEKVLMKKVLKKQEKNSKIEVEVFVKKKENITDYIDISDIDINSLNNKEED